LLRDYGIIGILLIICVLFAIWTKGLFLRPDNIVNVLRQISINAIIATGITLPIIIGGIDLSVGSVVAVVGILTAQIMVGLPKSLPVGLVISLASLAGMAFGALLGAFSGFTISRFRVPPFISTLAMMTGASGLAFILCDGRPVWNLPIEFNLVGRGYVLSGIFGNWFPVPVLIMAIVMIIAHIVLTHTPFGRYVYAIGGNEEASRLSGINVKNVKLMVFAFSGLTAAIGGIILTSRLASGQPNAGSGYELYAIAASVVGGTSLSGGEGTIPGTLVGALIMGVLNNGMNLAGVESYLQRIVLGAIILGAVLLDQIKRRRLA
jgi:ribose/xylose/arabinose/galactoside ABC-type transport system permease subunit